MTFQELLKLQTTTTKPVKVVDQSKEMKRGLELIESEARSKAAKIKARLANDSGQGEVPVRKTATKTAKLKSESTDKWVAVKGGSFHSIITVSGKKCAIAKTPCSIDDKKLEEMYRNCNSLLSVLGFRHIVISRAGESDI